MKDKKKTKDQLINELVELHQRIADLEALEAERKLAEEALRESEQRFRTIFESASDGILVADVETKKFYLGNKMICKMLGYSQEEITNLTVMAIHPEKDLPHVLEQLASGHLSL